jgi:ribosome biogenesis protein Tsr3
LIEEFYQEMRQALIREFKRQPTFQEINQSLLLAYSNFHNLHGESIAKGVKQTFDEKK